MANSALTLTWVPVIDARGRTRMEMRWLVAGQEASATHVVPKAA